MPCARSMLKNRSRIADAGDGMHRTAGKLVQWLGRAADQAQGAFRLEPHAQRAVEQRLVRRSSRWHPPAAQPCRRLAQRPGRQQPTVAEAPIAVDDDDFAIARQGVVLQSVVAHDRRRIRHSPAAAMRPADRGRSPPARRCGAPAIWTHRRRHADHRRHRRAARSRRSRRSRA